MTRAAFHQLIDEIPEEHLDRLAELVRAVNAQDRLGIQLALAPIVPPEPDEIALLAEITNDVPPQRCTSRRGVRSLGLDPPTSLAILAPICHALPHGWPSHHHSPRRT